MINSNVLVLSSVNIREFDTTGFCGILSCLRSHKILVIFLTHIEYKRLFLAVKLKIDCNCLMADARLCSVNDVIILHHF